jgi:hypothetical protein
MTDTDVSTSPDIESAEMSPGFVVSSEKSVAKLIAEKQNGLVLEYQVPLESETKNSFKNVVIYGPGSVLAEGDLNYLNKLSDRVCIAEVDDRAWVGFGVSNHGELLRILRESGKSAEAQIRAQLVVENGKAKKITVQNYGLKEEKLAQDVFSIIPKEKRAFIPQISGTFGIKEVGSDVVKLTKFGFEVGTVSNIIKKRPVDVSDPDGYWYVWSRISNFPQYLQKDFRGVNNQT